MERRLISSGHPLEATVGYSRAVAVGNRVIVSGTSSRMEDGGDPPADAYLQAKRCLEIVVAALAEAGAGPEDVVRTRIYLTSADVMDGVARAHAELFAEVRPACTAVVVTSLLDPLWLVEIEAEAFIVGAQ